jgi:hypothetical protein
MIEERLPAGRGISEILPPPQSEPSFRKREPATIDGEVVQAVEVIEKPSVFSGATDTHSADQPPVKPAPLDPVDHPSLIEVSIPTRSGWITKYVPRQQ